MRNTIVIAAAIVLLGAGCGRTTTPPAVSSPTHTQADVPPAPPISISEPAVGATVTSPITARGLGIAFENTIQVRVVDALGFTLGETNTIANAPDYTAPGPWEATVTYRIPVSTHGFLEAYESSAKDGRELHKVRVPIRFTEDTIDIPPDMNPHVMLRTNYGTMEMVLYAADAPKTVENFLRLAREKFYNGTQFHRVIPEFMIQGGDPLTREQPDNRAVHGTGGPGYVFGDESNTHKVVRGALAMANAGPNTNGSQFFIVTTAAAPWLDGKHTVFGEVEGEGMDIVDRIAQVERDQRNHPVDAVVIEEIIVIE